MAKSKKQKAHALRKELIKASLEREQEWKPETIKEDLAAFSDRYLKKAGKSNPRATHLTNIFRGLDRLIASQFGRTAPKTRLALQEYKDRYVFCSGVAIMVKVAPTPIHKAILLAFASRVRNNIVLETLIFLKN